MGLMVAGLALSAAGAAQQAAAARSAAEAEKNRAVFNAQVEENEAKAKKQASAFESARAAKASARDRSTLKTRLAKAGGLGSPVADDLAGFQESEQELDQLLIGFEGETLAQRHRNQAKLDRAGGRAADKRGKAAATAGGIRAGGTLLQGFNK